MRVVINFIDGLAHGSLGWRNSVSHGFVWDLCL